MDAFFWRMVRSVPVLLCVVACSAPSAEDLRVGVDDNTSAASKVVQNYVVQNKNWPSNTFKIVSKRQEGNTAVFWVIHKDDERRKDFGGGKSIEVHVDLTELRVSRELHFQ
jgi:hypothetical protein